jgi:hypothetical protein
LNIASLTFSPHVGHAAYLAVEIGVVSETADHDQYAWSEARELHLAMSTIFECGVVTKREGPVSINALIWNWYLTQLIESAEKLQKRLLMFPPCEELRLALEQLTHKLIYVCIVTYLLVVWQILVQYKFIAALWLTFQADPWGGITQQEPPELHDTSIRQPYKHLQELVAVRARTRPQQRCQKT